MELTSRPRSRSARWSAPAGQPCVPAAIGARHGADPGGARRRSRRQMGRPPSA